ncbi:glycosyltransferase family 2 protein [Algibacter sp. L1A34]|uniref:glycosyltransferase family 2 protein n=1 Tax=Algibacter sp. L1A34 TaxID=2686365 RepID=UPI00131B0530|nr:glycosyltransferase family 2 protein [Algibacter sp. L1A34]
MNQSQPLISIVLPVYNVERYITEAMDSILKQTVQDFEILVIDDCSTDNTIKIVESYNDNRVKVIKKEKNKGLIHSLNLGFSLAKGKYIARMDGDDINELERFEKQLHILETYPEIITCGSWIKYFGGHDTVIKHCEKHDAIVAQMLVKCPMSLGCCMLRTSAVRAFSFNNDKVHVEDYDFWSRIAWNGKLYNIQEVLYNYRSHESQVSSLYKDIQVEGDMEIQLFLFKKLEYDENKYTDTFLKKFLLKQEHIKVEALELFIDWQKKIVALNKKNRVFETKELKTILNQIKRSIIYNIYFTNGFKEIDKKWRTQALFKLPIKDFVYVAKMKIKEKTNFLFKQVLSKSFYDF